MIFFFFGGGGAKKEPNMVKSTCNIHHVITTFFRLIPLFMGSFKYFGWNFKSFYDMFVFSIRARQPRVSLDKASKFNPFGCLNFFKEGFANLGQV